MKTTLFALAGMPAFCLCAAVALAGELPPPDATPQTSLISSDVIKNKGQCPTGTSFYKNAFPSLTNGSEGGCKTEVFAVGGKNVSMEVCWGPRLDPDPDIALAENAFEISLDGGVVHRLGVSVDTNDWIFDFNTPVFKERVFNFYFDGRADAADVSHLDICMEAADTVAPQVGEILVVPSTDGTTVSGEITISTEVTDESEQLVQIELVDSDGVPYTSFVTYEGTDTCAEPVSGCVKYLWSLDTGEIPEGEYTVKITSTDDTLLGQSSFNTKDILVVRSLLNCLDNTDGVDGVPDGPSDGGCNLTGAVQLEYPGEIEQYVGLLQVSQAFVPAKAGSSSQFCNPNGLYPNIAHDPRVSTGDGITVIDNTTQDLSAIFELPVDKVVLSAEVVGSPCLALVEQDAPDFSEIYPLLPPNFTYDEGPVYTFTQFPEEVPGMYKYISRYTAPLNYNPTSALQKDPQNVEQASYQTDIRFDLVLPFAQALTNFIYNPPRSSGFKGSYFPINTREVCPDIPIVSPTTDAYIADVYQCKIDLALRYEADTEQALVEADALGALVSPSLNNLLNWLNRAQSQIKNMHFERCVSNLERLESDVVNGEWLDIPDPMTFVLAIAGAGGSTGTGFVPGDLVTQAVTGATGYVVYADEAQDELALYLDSGTFSGDNNITGASGGTFTAGTGATYTATNEPRNDQGRVLTYVRNLTWRCEQLLLTEAYLDSLP